MVVSVRNGMIGAALPFAMTVAPTLSFQPSVVSLAPLFFIWGYEF
jgi:hypothetical protein